MHRGTSHDNVVVCRCRGRRSHFFTKRFLMDREIYVNQIRKVTSHGAKKTESRDVDAKALPKPTATKKNLQYRVDCFLAGNL